MGRYLDLARKAVFATSDPHAELVRDALDQLANRPYFAGAMPWLEEAYPEIHNAVMTGIPSRIDTMWRIRAPIVDFQQVLEEWVSAHHRASSLYAEFLTKSPDITEKKGGHRVKSETLAIPT